MFMHQNLFPKKKAIVIACLLVLSVPGLRAEDQTFQPANWVNDPFCFNPNYGIIMANSASPCFTNNGVQRGTLYANCPIGDKIKLVNPGDMISCAGQVTIEGDVNNNGNLQFRVGLYYQGTNNADTNWLGYMFGNIAGDGSEADISLMVRNNPNPGVFGSGSVGNAMRPKCSDINYVPGWTADSYDFKLSVSQLADNHQKISWKLAAVSPGTYNYSGTYTNILALTASLAFDQVGIMGGAALFQSASVSNRISLKNVTVTLQKSADGH
jgi:hypothetical protein